MSLVTFPRMGSLGKISARAFPVPRHFSMVTNTAALANRSNMAMFPAFNVWGKAPGAQKVPFTFAYKYEVKPAPVKKLKKKKLPPIFLQDQRHQARFPNFARQGGGGQLGSFA